MWNMAPQTIAIEAKAVPKKLTTPRQRTCFAFKHTLHTQFHFSVHVAPQSLCTESSSRLPAHYFFWTPAKHFFGFFLDNFPILGISFKKVGAK
jgi:hypothetical protein